jgi:hypothetical protein
MASISKRKTANRAWRKWRSWKRVVSEAALRIAIGRDRLVKVENPAEIEYRIAVLCDTDESGNELNRCEY